MSPELLAQLGLAAGSALASGLRVYGTVAALGLLQRFGVIHLPPGLEPLASTPVLVLACVLYVAEFVADKIPVFDSVWDGIHTFIRVPAAGVLGFAALGDMAEPWRTVAALLCGGVALSAHGVKAGARLAANASPEPLSNWGLSFGEDVSVVGVLWLVFAHPFVAVALAVATLIAGLSLASWLVAVLRRLARRREAAA